jgi:hypothetical protein
VFQQHHGVVSVFALVAAGGEADDPVEFLKMKFFALALHQSKYPPVLYLRLAANRGKAAVGSAPVVRHLPDQTGTATSSPSDTASSQSLKGFAKEE